MALGYPVASGAGRETQQFGPAMGAYAYLQPAMFATGASVAWWQSYKGWRYYPDYHNGLDIGAAEGTALLAMETGKVVFSGWRNNGGGLVIGVQIRLGTIYWFNHCSALLVAVGTIVKKGQAIARVGATGVATGNHCHVSLEIQERGPDGIIRTLMWNPKLWMSGKAYANDIRIASVYGTTQVQRVVINGNGINIRSSANLESWALFAGSVSGRFRRYSDWKDLGAITSALLFYRYVQGDAYVVNGVRGNLYAEVYLGGGRRFIAKPYCSAPRWYAS